MLSKEAGAIRRPVITSRGGLSRPLKAARNRLNTETRIIQAVGAVLENDGFEKVGVNLVARPLLSIRF